MIRVTIVETDRRQRDRLGKAVSKASGLTCLRTHATSEEALAHLGVETPDLLLMDIDESQDTSMETLAVLKSAYPSVIVLVATTAENNPAVLQALRAGSRGCLLKNISPDEIAASIRHAYHGGSPLPASVARQLLPLFNRGKPSTPSALKLSPREEKIIKLLADGLHYKEIAAELVLSLSTVRAHLHTIYNKLNAASRTEAVARYQAQFQNN